MKDRTRTPTLRLRLRRLRGRLGKSETTSFMQQFAARRDSSCVVHLENDVEWLEVNDPTQLANFVAFCKARGRRIYLRGQHSRHLQLLPSLFREPGDHQARWRAYKAFLRRLPAGVKGSRFRRRNFGAVLQHYGFRTSWLDVVDDLHAAVWFALNSATMIGEGQTYHHTNSHNGWIAVISVPREVRHQDLRETQSSRNTRCHAQQGWSVAMQYDNAPEYHRRQDFAEYVVGTVRIPNSDKWHLTGFMASQSYLFPSEEMDDTYRQLRSPTVSDLATEIETKEGLPLSALGRAALYAEPT